MFKSTTIAEESIYSLYYLWYPVFLIQTEL